MVRYKYNMLATQPDVIGRYFAAAKELKLVDSGAPPFLAHHATKIQNRIAIAPGAKHWNKRWPVENFIELARELVSRGFEVSLIGAEAERDTTGAIKAAVPHAIDLAGTMTLTEVTEHIASAGLTIANDSGLMHVADAVGTRVISLFGPTVAEFGFAPRSPESVMLEVPKLYCRPCTAIGDRKSVV